MKNKFVKSFISRYILLKNYFYSWLFFFLISVGILVFFLFFSFYFLFIFNFNFQSFFIFELNSFFFFFNLSSFFFHFDNLIFYFDGLKFLNCIVLNPKWNNWLNFEIYPVSFLRFPFIDDGCSFVFENQYIYGL
jgi:hypothetical protein